MFFLTKGQIVAGDTKAWIGNNTTSEISMVGHEHSQYVDENSVSSIVENLITNLPSIKITSLGTINFNKTTNSRKCATLGTFTESFDANNVFGIVLDLNITKLSCTMTTDDNYGYSTIALALINDPTNYYPTNFSTGSTEYNKGHPGLENVFLALTVTTSGTTNFNSIKRKLFIPYSVICEYIQGIYPNTSDFLVSTSTLRKIDGPGSNQTNSIVNSATSNMVYYTNNTITSNIIDKLKVLVLRDLGNENSGSSSSNIDTIKVNGSCTVYTLSL